ncbi:aspartate-semialdehyde dehydrogenase [Saprospira grandis]|uniref:Aspartate-semialdehyde dehydrogenase n=1 Tax=Saprospira grandis (strain Lewin) TaxID=984262 RepID=H6L6Q6_SAPGL|nr:aspartate-semialdehyde dehydrogenase [Saprospira grandis]AFC25302.1 aspartate-semialdehyde dehydrogenase [Saprospira grandis str. Lewin]
MKLALVGASGMVGQVMLKLLEERNFPLSQLLPVASARSKGKTVRFKGQDIPLLLAEEALAQKPNLALFSAGGSVSLALAPKFAAIGCKVIDNSSAFRMDQDKPLIVPEVNLDQLKADDFIIANPNCSTIQLLLALWPLEKKYGLERVLVSTYQSMTGTGMKALQQYQEELQGKTPQNPAYPQPIFENCLPHCDVFVEDGYTKEEIKLLNESRKIMNLPELRLSATAVRVPVMGGHSEAVNIALKTPFELADIRELLAQSPGVVVQDNPSENLYPMPLSAKGKDEVFVGRIRRDFSQENGLHLWIVADNLHKGAATNALQIAEALIEKGWL